MEPTGAHLVIGVRLQCGDHSERRRKVALQAQGRSSVISRWVNRLHDHGKFVVGCRTTINSLVLFQTSISILQWDHRLPAAAGSKPLGCSEALFPT
jgi:hypothetical protein